MRRNDNVPFLINCKANTHQATLNKPKADKDNLLMFVRQHRIASFIGIMLCYTSKQAIM